MFIITDDILDTRDYLFRDMNRDGESSEKDSMMYDMIYNNIHRLFDNKYDNKIYNSMILTGGNTSTYKYIDNTRQMVDNINSNYNIQCRLFTYPNDNIRLYSSWIGGSIFASIDNFLQFYVNKNDILEYGESIIDRKLI